ncbi:hypothetical protein H5410_009309 [Solanum commersonii]|uniref:Uncharacterized protein n=1 Tax=Solanum commersonii TaxID=4109 RepID=A0A9J6AID0_SOLCO|nr:hypothetical protein H5410_009309 [Solanum commersonii]
MRDTPTNSTICLDPNNTSSFWQWKSPLPYLFGGLALTLALIIVALLLLVFSFYQPWSDEEEEDKSASRGNNSTSMVEMSPRIIVILAGERKPTHIGVPISSSDKCPH